LTGCCKCVIISFALVYSPVKTSSAVTPIDHTSAALVGAYLCSSSGALYIEVPKTKKIER